MKLELWKLADAAQVLTMGRHRGRIKDCDRSQKNNC